MVPAELSGTGPAEPSGAGFPIQALLGVLQRRHLEGLRPRTVAASSEPVGVPLRRGASVRGRLSALLRKGSGRKPFRPFRRRRPAAPAAGPAGSSLDLLPERPRRAARAPGSPLGVLSGPVQLRVRSHAPSPPRPLDAPGVRLVPGGGAGTLPVQGAERRAPALDVDRALGSARGGTRFVEQQGRPRRAARAGFFLHALQGACRVVVTPVRLHSRRGSVCGQPGFHPPGIVSARHVFRARGVLRSSFGGIAACRRRPARRVRAPVPNGPRRAPFRPVPPGSVLQHVFHPGRLAGRRAAVLVRPRAVLHDPARFRRQVRPRFSRRLPTALSRGRSRAGGLRPVLHPGELSQLPVPDDRAAQPAPGRSGSDCNGDPASRRGATCPDSEKGESRDPGPGNGRTLRTALPRVPAAVSRQEALEDVRGRGPAARGLSPARIRSAALGRFLVRQLPWSGHYGQAASGSSTCTEIRGS